MNQEKLHTIVIERSRCCGYGLCAAVCPEIYKLDENGIVFIDSEFVPAGLEEAAIEGAASCPAEAIMVQAPSA